MFQSFENVLEALAIGLAGLGIGAGALGFVVLGLMNMAGILDPRLGAQVKMGLIKVCMSLAFLGIGAGIVPLATAISAGHP